MRRAVFSSVIALLAAGAVSAAAVSHIFNSHPSADLYEALLRDANPNQTLTIEHEPLGEEHYRMRIDYDGDGAVDQILTVDGPVVTFERVE